jgi:hypothetical protein
VGSRFDEGPVAVSKRFKGQSRTASYPLQAVDKDVIIVNLQVRVIFDGMFPKHKIRTGGKLKLGAKVRLARRFRPVGVTNRGSCRPRELAGMTASMRFCRLLGAFRFLEGWPQRLLLLVEIVMTLPGSLDGQQLSLKVLVVVGRNVPRITGERLQAVRGQEAAEVVLGLEMQPQLEDAGRNSGSKVVVPIVVV